MTMYTIWPWTSMRVPRAWARRWEARFREVPALGGWTLRLFWCHGGYPTGPAYACLCRVGG